MSSMTIKTKHAPWIKYRTVLSTESALSVTGRKGVSVPSNAYVIPEAMNNMEVRVAAVVSAGMECTASFYGARYLDKGAKTFDDISLIGSAALTSGDQLSSDNFYYVDTSVLIDRWITEVKNVDGMGNNGMTRIAFDTSGYDVFFVILTYTDSTDWVIDISGW